MTTAAPSFVHDISQSAGGRDPSDVRRLAEDLERIQQDCAGRGLEVEAATLRPAIAMLKSLATTDLKSALDRGKWALRGGLIEDTCIYLTRMAADPKRRGSDADAETLRAGAAMIRHMFSIVTADNAV